MEQPKTVPGKVVFPDGSSQKLVVKFSGYQNPQIDIAIAQVPVPDPFVTGRGRPNAKIRFVSDDQSINVPAKGCRHFGLPGSRDYREEAVFEVPVAKLE